MFDIQEYINRQLTEFIPPIDHNDEESPPDALHHPAMSALSVANMSSVVGSWEWIVNEAQRPAFVFH